MFQPACERSLVYKGLSASVKAKHGDKVKYQRVSAAVEFQCSTACTNMCIVTMGKEGKVEAAAAC